MGAGWSPVVLCSLSVVNEEASPGRKVLVTRTMNGVSHLQTDFDCPHALGVLFLSNRMCQALMFSCDCRWGVLGVLWCSI